MSEVSGKARRAPLELSGGFPPQVSARRRLRQRCKALSEATFGICCGTMRNCRNSPGPLPTTPGDPTSSTKILEENRQLSGNTPSCTFRCHRTQRGPGNGEPLREHKLYLEMSFQGGQRIRKSLCQNVVLDDATPHARTIAYMQELMPKTGSMPILVRNWPSRRNFHQF